MTESHTTKTLDQRIEPVTEDLLGVLVEVPDDLEFAVLAIVEKELRGELRSCVSEDVAEELERQLTEVTRRLEAAPAPPNPGA